MPKHVIEFNLPEDKEELDTILKASEYLCVIDEMRTYLRSMVKYEGYPTEQRALTDEEYALAAIIYEAFLKISVDLD